MRMAGSRRACTTAVAFLLALAGTGEAQYSGGSGTPEDPYQIATAADLIALGETPEDYDKHSVLTADIDLDPNLPAEALSPTWGLTRSILGGYILRMENLRS